MTDLPSRDNVKADIDLLRRNTWDHNEGAPLPFSSILAAYVSGRLVDREAIDYEAGYDKAGSIGLPRPFLLDDIKQIVAAAIGDTDEGLAASRHYFDEAAKRDE